VAWTDRSDPSNSFSVPCSVLRLVSPAPSPLAPRSVFQSAFCAWIGPARSFPRYVLHLPLASRWRCPVLSLHVPFWPCFALHLILLFVFVHSYGQSFLFLWSTRTLPPSLVPSCWSFVYGCVSRPWSSTARGCMTCVSVRPFVFFSLSTFRKCSLLSSCSVPRPWTETCTHLVQPVAANIVSMPTEPSLVDPSHLPLNPSLSPSFPLNPSLSPCFPLNLCPS